MNVVLYSGGYDSEVLRSLLNFHNADPKLFHASIYSNNDMINKAETSLIKARDLNVDFEEELHLKKVEEYVPNRNSLLVLQCANILAHYEGQHTIFIGLIRNAIPFPDCTLEWVENINELLFTEFGGRIRLVAPFLFFFKDYVYRIGTTLGVKLEDTFTCNFEDSSGKPCGKCWECKWRAGKKRFKFYINKSEWRELNNEFEKLLQNRV